MTAAPRPAAARRVAIVGGGTAGHVYPALAVAAAYRQAVPEVDVLFIGAGDGFDARLVPRYGYRFHAVRGLPLYGVGVVAKLRAIQHVFAGTADARRVLRAHGTQLVIGFGGYATAGTMLAARRARLPTAIHEANVVAGLTNRLLGRCVERVYLGFDSAARAFPVRRTLVTGNPVRPELLALVDTQRHAPRPAERPVRILVTGGSQGAQFLNRQVPPLLRQLRALGLRVDVRHQVGDWGADAVCVAYAQGGIEATVTAYIDDMAAAYGWADFAVTRAGAVTIAELGTAGLPALVVPLPTAAGDHQTANATAFAAAGGWWVSEAAWSCAAEAERIAGLLRDPEAWMAASRRLRQLATPGAAAAVVADCEARLVRGQWPAVADVRGPAS